ncbi:hypothetical protein TRVA0_012S02410 [Trichomonascus vanleenenianus]|uniref:uncharacterized protein n=1 Tax=Trichomonascus vanleenenianus TaxID=2268995 RepID=UPI003EC9F41A
MTDYGSIGSEEDRPGDEELSYAAKLRSIYLLLGTTLLFVIGQTALFPATIDVLIGLICREEYMVVTGTEVGSSGSHRLYDDPRCYGSGIAGRVATFVSYDTAIINALGVLVIPKLAEMSDRVGRKPILLWGGVAAALSDTIRTLCVRYPGVLNYRWLLVASFFRGAGGSIQMFQLMNSTYITDLVPADRRARLFSLMEAVMFGGLACGPLLGSLALERFESFSLLFVMTIGCDVAYFVVIALFLRESYTKPEEPQKPQPVRLGGLWTRIVNIVRPLRTLKFSHLAKKRRRNARTLVAIMAVMSDIFMSLAPIFVLFADFRFGWTAVETGYLLAMLGLSRAVVLALAYPRAHAFWARHIGPQLHRGLDRIDGLFLRFGLLTAGTCITVMGHAPNGSVYTAILIVDAVAAVLIPTLKNGIVKYVRPGQIGGALGALGLLANITMIIFTQGFYRFFKFTADRGHPEAIFEMAGALLFVLFFTTLLLDFHTQDEEAWERLEEYTSTPHNNPV